MTVLPRRRPDEVFPVVIVAIGNVFQTRPESAMSCTGMVRGYGVPLIGTNTEAAPNSYTGSGRCMFPCSDGMASLPLFRGDGEALRPRNLSVPRAGKQDGELDLRRVACFSPGAFAAESRPRQTRHRQAATHRLSSKPARHVGGLGRLHAFESPRSPARRPIQVDEVELSAHVSRGGIASQIETHSLCSLICASVRRTARHAGPRLVQLLFMIGISRRIG